MPQEGDNELALCVCCICGVRFGVDRTFYAFLADHVGGLVRPDSDDEDIEGTVDGLESNDEQGGYYNCPNGHLQRVVTPVSRKLYNKLVKATQRMERLEAENYALQDKVAELNEKRPARPSKARARRPENKTKGGRGDGK